MQVLGRQLLVEALRDVNLVGLHDDPDEEELQLAIDEMNELLDQLATDKHFITGNESHDFQFVPGKGTYTLGPGGDWPLSEAPERIDFWSVIASRGSIGEREHPREDLLDERRWQGISGKLQTSEIPFVAFTPWKIDAQGRITIQFVPVPSSATYWARLYLFSPSITEIDPSRRYNLPRGYKKALRKLLAVELMQSQQRDIDPVLVSQAQKGLKLIKRQNRKQPERSPIDASFLTGAYRRGYLGGRGYGIRDW